MQGHFNVAVKDFSLFNAKYYLNIHNHPRSGDQDKVRDTENGFHLVDELKIKVINLLYRFISARANNYSKQRLCLFYENSLIA